MKYITLVLLLFVRNYSIVHAQEKSCGFNAFSMYEKDTIEFRKHSIQLSGIEGFFSSENHIFKQCKDAEIITFKSLVLNYGVRNLLIEFPYSYTFCINKFFETGDSSYVCKDGQCKLSYPEYVNKLYTLYKELPDDRKFKLWGIDFDLDEGRRLSYITAIHKLLYEVRLNDDIRRDIFDDTLLSTSKLKNINTRLQKMLLLDADFKQQLIKKGHYNDILLLVNTPVEKSNLTARNKEMANRIDEFKPYFLTAGNKAKYYGQIGLMHTVRNKHSLINCVEEKAPSGGICTIGALFYNCRSNIYNDNKDIIKNTEIRGDNVFDCLKNKMSPGSIYIIPDTKNINTFNLTYIYYGFE